MGLFQNKQQAPQLPDDEVTDSVQQFFDGYFQELNERGRAHFDEVIQQQTARFEEDLSSSISSINADLRAYITKRIDEQIAENAKSIRVAQAAALESINASVESLQKQTTSFSATLEEQFEHSRNAIKSTQAEATKAMDRTVQTLEEQHRNLGNALQKNVARQDAQLGELFEQNKSQLTNMKQSQDAALEWLNRSITTLQEQQEQLSSTFQQSVAYQQQMLVTAFEQNMAQIVEHYLLGAIGDQYDLKSQLPSIIKQLEASKETIVGDMKL